MRSTKSRNALSGRPRRLEKCAAVPGIVDGMKYAATHRHPWRTGLSWVDDPNKLAQSLFGNDKVTLPGLMEAVGSLPGGDDDVRDIALSTIKATLMVLIVKSCDGVLGHLSGPWKQTGGAELFDPGLQGLTRAFLDICRTEATVRHTMALAPSTVTTKETENAGTDCGSA